MKRLILTKRQTKELRRAHRLVKDKREADRIKAIYLLSLGKTRQEIAEVLMLDEDTIDNYQNRYESGGVEALLKDNYQGSLPMLSDTEILELTEHLEATTYLTVESIVAFVKNIYKIEYSISGMRQLLHRLGFVYKKAKSVPGKANAELQLAYIEMLEKVLKNKGKNDPHYYLDGVHPQHNTQLAYGWIKKGEEKIIKANSGRKRININGALNVDNLDVVIREDDTINTQSTLKLFETIEEKHPEAETIFMTLDNAKYYKNSLIQDYLETSKIKLLFLPAYSPNLNLIERLWKYMRKTILYNKYYAKFAEFKFTIMDFFKNIAQHKSKLVTLLTQNFQVLDAA